MVAKPGIAIYVTAGDEAPVVFYTAVSAPEVRAVDSWLARHPGLGVLVETAWKLADEEATRDAAAQAGDELARRRRTRPKA